MLLWTLRRFGPRQADVYEAEFLAAFERLVDGTLTGRGARAEWGEDMPDDLLFVRVRSHVVTYVDAAERIEVADVLHEAMDLPGRVRG